MTIPMITEQKELPLRSAWVVRQEVRFFSVAENDWIPWTGTDIRVRFSRDQTGFTSDGSVSTTLGPVTMVATGEPGWYYAIISAEDVLLKFSALVGRVVYQVVEGAFGTTSYALTNVQPLLVIDPLSPIF